MTRFCVGCEKYRRDVGEPARCADERATIPPTDFLVTGSTSQQRPCLELRSERNACGRDALWYVERDVPASASPVAAIATDIRQGGPLAQLIQDVYGLTRLNQ